MLLMSPSGMVEIPRLQAKEVFAKWSADLRLRCALSGFETKPTMSKFWIWVKLTSVGKTRGTLVLKQLNNLSQNQRPVPFSSNLITCLRTNVPSPFLALPILRCPASSLPPDPLSWGTHRDEENKSIQKQRQAPQILTDPE